MKTGGEYDVTAGFSPGPGSIVETVMSNPEFSSHDARA